VVEKEGVAPAMQRRTTLFALLGLVVVAAAGGALIHFDRPDPAPRPAQLIPVIQEASVAVLPFVNMSGDPQKEYFSDAISGELSDALADMQGVLVASRNSSFAFKGKNTDIKDIARKLRVRAVLEGSVRDEGNRVRITAQLISAATGLHLWSQTYDRDLGDFPQLQNDIAASIARALTDRRGADDTRAPKRVDPEVYRKYLQARYEFTWGSMNSARDLAKDVTHRAPDFAPGFALLAHASGRLAGDRSDFDDAVVPAERALALDPDNSEARLAHLQLSLLRWDWHPATEDADHLLTANPNNAAVLYGLAYYYRHLGFPEKGYGYRASAAWLDPSYDWRGEYAVSMGRDDARAGLISAHAGNLTDALDQFEHSYEDRDIALTTVPYDPATPRTLMDDPRWKALWRKPELKAWQEEHDRVASTLASPALR
jgi:TolB-like protein